MPDNDYRHEPGAIKPPAEAEKGAGFRFDRSVGAFLERSDSVVYGIVGFCFVLGAFFALAYSFWSFGLALTQIPDTGQTGFIANTIISLISNLLLVLIIMEVLGTVTEYLRTHANSVRPFLFIGIISATRGILSIGARLSVEKVSLPSPEFTSDMIELGVNAGAILALGITLMLLGREKDR